MDVEFAPWVSTPEGQVLELIDLPPFRRDPLEGPDSHHAPTPIDALTICKACSTAQHGYLELMAGVSFTSVARVDPSFLHKKPARLKDHV